MHKNAIQTLPGEMGQLVAVRKLNLMENDLHSLPPDFKNLKKLEDLDLRNNPLCSDKLGAGEWKKLIPHLTSRKQLRTGNTQPTVCPCSVSSTNTESRLLGCHQRRLARRTISRNLLHGVAVARFPC